MKKLALTIQAIFFTPLEFIRHLQWRKIMLSDHLEICKKDESDEIKIAVKTATYCYRKRILAVLKFDGMKTFHWNEMYWKQRNKAEKIFIRAMDRELGEISK